MAARKRATAGRAAQKRGNGPVAAAKHRAAAQRAAASGQETTRRVSSLRAWAFDEERQLAREVIEFCRGFVAGPTASGAARVIDAYRATRGAPVKFNHEQQRWFAVRIVEHWLPTIRTDAGDREAHISALLSELGNQLDDDSFRVHEIGGVDVEVFLRRPYWAARRIAAWLILRAGALGGRKLEIPTPKQIEDERHRLTKAEYLAKRRVHKK